MLHINHETNATNAKYLGLGNKSGVGGTHRHSLEKLKEYESQLLMSSSENRANNELNRYNADHQNERSSDQKLEIRTAANTNSKYQFESS